jgi:hypothetical protein
VSAAGRFSLLVWLRATWFGAKHEPEIGQLLTLGLCSFSGLKRNNRWLDVLSGANLLSPALPRAALVRQATATQQVSVFKQAPDGTLRIVPNGESLWTR